MPERLRLFHALPYPLKCVAVGVHGFRLQRVRYGPETARLIDEARERERWDETELGRWQQDRLQELLGRAARSVPHYRSLTNAADLQIRGDELEGWPVLSKEVVRGNPASFVADDVDASTTHQIQTSGSTGTPLTIRVGTESLRRWYALFEARWRIWHGVDRSDRWAILGGRLITHQRRSRPPYWVWNCAMRQLYLSAYHISRESTGHYLAAMDRHRVTYLLGYPSAIYDLCRHALDLRLQVPELKVVVSNAEPLFDHQRQLISRVFGCDVRSTYGMAEMVCGAGECEHGTMHLWPEAGVVEVLDDRDRPVPRGEVGRLICTGLINAEMPLIRYEVGDRGALAPDDETCACGRSLPIVSCVEGRLDDVVVTPDGRTVGRLDTVFKASLPIRAAQIIQDSRDSLNVRVVPDDGFDAVTEREISSRLRDRVGGMVIRIDRVNEIPRGPNGKIRAVVSELG